MFNPLDKKNLAESIVREILKTKTHQLGRASGIVGAGVYAIYYTGQYPDYAALAAANRTEATIPIYIGKAIPAGGRKGASMDAAATSDALAKRLKEHADTINEVDSLELQDFQFRYLVIDDIWISLAENFLLAKYKPLWNAVCDGFGNHAPGGGRKDTKRPIWDELHRGRKWAEALMPSKFTLPEIRQKIHEYMLGLPLLSEGTEPHSR